MNDKIKEVMDKTIIDEFLLILLGIALLIWPHAALNLVFRVVGIVLLIMGILRVVAYAKNRADVEGKDLIIGIVMGIAGLLLLITPNTFISIGPICAAILIGYGAIVSLIRSVKAMRAGVKGGIASVVISAIAIVLAIIVLFHPVGFANFLVRFIGIAMIIAGISMIISSYQNSKV